MPSRQGRRAWIWGGWVSLAAMGTAGCFGGSSNVGPGEDAGPSNTADAAPGDDAASADGGTGAGDTDGGILGAGDGATVDTGTNTTDAGACAGGGGPGTFTCTGSLSVPRQAPGAAVLANGKVLVAGGWNGASGTLSSAELYDPAAATFSATGPMSAGHLWSDWEAPWPVVGGKVLAAGGLDSAGNLLTGAELYDPAAATFSPTGPLGTAVVAYAATPLADGTALFIGGYSAVVVQPPTPAWSYTGGTAAVQRYDAASGLFTGAGTLAEGRLFGCNARLPSGDVLAIGGWVGSAPTFESNIERFDATGGSWTTVGTLGAGVTCGAVAFALPNGQVFLDSSTLLDPTTYATTAATNALALTSPSLVQLANGDVLAAGGTVGGVATARAQVYHAATNVWTDAGSMHFARGGGHRLLLLATGDVLVVGGGDANGALASAELYHP